jgi:excisionase family DNA binding protein
VPPGDLAAGRERGNVALSVSASLRLLDAQQVAEIIGMRVDYVYDLCRRNAIPHNRFGRTLRFREETIADWLRESEHGSMSG